jgi:hypothetical protein
LQPPRDVEPPSLRYGQEDPCSLTNQSARHDPSLVTNPARQHHSWIHNCWRLQGSKPRCCHQLAHLFSLIGFQTRKSTA